MNMKFSVKKFIEKKRKTGTQLAILKFIGYIGQYDNYYDGKDAKASREGTMAIGFQVVEQDQEGKITESYEKFIEVKFSPWTAGGFVKCLVAANGGKDLDEEPDFKEFLGRTIKVNLFEERSKPKPAANDDADGEKKKTSKQDRFNKSYMQIEDKT